MKILIIEDEPQIAEVMKDIILKLRPDSEMLGITSSIDESVRFLVQPQNEPDLIFMDIQLADGLSFEIFSRVAINCPVVFCTAYEQYKMQASVSTVLDYILKPIKDSDVCLVFEKMEKLHPDKYVN